MDGEEDGVMVEAGVVVTEDGEEAGVMVVDGEGGERPVPSHKPEVAGLDLTQRHVIQEVAGPLVVEVIIPQAPHVDLQVSIVACVVTSLFCTKFLLILIGSCALDVQEEITKIENNNNRLS